LSEIFFAQGDLELCAELCQQLMAEAVGDPSMLDDQGSARLVLANVAYERNELERAERYASEALDLAEQRANELLQVQALSCLALICAARGEPARDRLRALAARLQSQLALRELRETEALLAVRMGEPPAAWLASNHPELLSQKEREAFIWARQRISEKQSAEALELINPYLSDAAEHGRVRSQVEALCLKALAQQAAGELHQAGLTLTHALTIGNEKGFRRLFLDEGASMALLVQEILPRLTKPVLRLYATTLLHLFSPNDVSTSQDVNSPQALVEPLSQQEARVLKLLVAGLSNGEIASELIVSTNTVKTHVKSIYRKLNIRSREEARVVVKELKLT
jgi:LuxR family maltose regulon positive regulatory protein